MSDPCVFSLHIGPTGSCWVKSGDGGEGFIPSNAFDPGLVDTPQKVVERTLRAVAEATGSEPGDVRVTGKKVIGV